MNHTAVFFKVDTYTRLPLTCRLDDIHERAVMDYQQFYKISGKTFLFQLRTINPASFHELLQQQHVVFIPTDPGQDILVMERCPVHSGFYQRSALYGESRDKVYVKTIENGADVWMFSVSLFHFPGLFRNFPGNIKPFFFKILTRPVGWEHNENIQVMLP